MQDNTLQGIERPQGLKLVKEAITSDQETELLVAMEGLPFSYYAGGPGNPRSSVSFGWKHDFTNDTFVLCAPIPDEFRQVCEVAADCAGIHPSEIVECLVNCYETGAIIRPHLDKPVWNHIVGLSLGSDVIEVRLPPRSI